MAGVTVFGRPSTSDIASRVLDSASLNANPSPDSPQKVPADQRASAYARLLAACYELKKVETDPFKLSELATCEAFADREYTAIVEAEMGGPPGSSVLVPAQSPAPQPTAQPQAGPQPAIQPGTTAAPTPGAPASQGPVSA